MCLRMCVCVCVRVCVYACAWVCACACVHTMHKPVDIPHASANGLLEPGETSAFPFSTSRDGYWADPAVLLANPGTTAPRMMMAPVRGHCPPSFDPPTPGVMQFERSRCLKLCLVCVSRECSIVFNKLYKYRYLSKWQQRDDQWHILPPEAKPILPALTWRPHAWCLCL